MTDTSNELRGARKARRSQRRAARASSLALAARGGDAETVGAPVRLIGFPNRAKHVWTSAVDLQTRSYADAIAVPLHEAEVQGKLVGAAYDRIGRIIVDSERGKGNKAWAGNPSRLSTSVENPRVLPGRTFFGGYLREVFGHFLLEVLPRFWPPDDFTSFDHIMFYPTRIGVPPGPPTFGAYAQDMFAALGVDPSRAMAVVDELVVCEELVVTTPAFGLKQYATPQFAVPFRRIADNLDGGQTAGPRIYLSRSQLAPHYRGADNEAEIESMMTDRGFTVLFPEKMSIADQVAAVRGADVVVGCDGSNMHLVAFATAETKVVGIDSRYVPNQIMIEAMCGADATHVLAVQGRLNQRMDRWLCDLDVVAKTLDDLGIA